MQGDEVEEFWAIKDITTTFNPASVGGIISRNDAGKSTGLKILSRITEPTRGRVPINGRVGSLLEVGTGFHPELTGRENIFLNGAILGMGRKEIQTVGWAKAIAVPNKVIDGVLRSKNAAVAGRVYAAAYTKTKSIPATGQANVGSAGLTRYSNPATG